MTEAGIKPPTVISCSPVLHASELAMVTQIEITSRRQFNNLIVIHTIKFVIDRLENIVGQEENAAYQLFLLFPQCF